MIDQEEIHAKCLSEDPKKRIEALEQLKYYFSIPDKQQAWNDLHKLTSDKDSNVRSNAAYAIGSAYSQVPDKQEAWDDLHRLANDKNSDVRYYVASAIGSAFSHVPDKQKAWNDLHKLTSDEDRYVRSDAARAIGSAFSHVPDRQQAWKDLHKLTSDENKYVRFDTAYAIGSAFSHVPDKQQAWNDLHRLTNDEDSDVRYSAVSAIGSAFSHVPDKQKAWNDLHRLTNDADRDMRCNAANAIGSAFSRVPDKQQAWNDLIRLTSDRDSDVWFYAAYAIGSAYSQMPDKQQAWNDLHKLTNGKDKYVRSYAAYAIGSAYSQMPDKQEAWDDLHRLANDKNSDVRYYVVSAIGSVFSDVPDKQQAWNDLHRLTSDADGNVRSDAARAIGSAFSHVPDKQQAWNDLHRLTNDAYINVRPIAASAIGSAYSHVTDKQQVLEDLVKLTNDENEIVRSQANHSLGKISIFESSQAENEEDYKNELEKAIEFFGKSAQESFYSLNSSRFCLPFYRSFHAVVFQKQEAKEEISRYLAEAKDAIEGSKDKELLLEAVNNLANALNEVQNLEKLDLETKISELNFYRRYCDRAAELMNEIEKKAPYATATMRKGLPILDRRLKNLFEDIQKRARVACKDSKGTGTEKIACAVSNEVQKWKIGNQEEMNWYVNNLVVVLKSRIPHSTENKEILDMIEDMKYEKELTKQYRTLSTVIGLIPTVNVVSEQELDQKLDQKLQKFDLIFGEIIYIQDKLSCISFDISKIKLNSADLLSDLKTMKEELEKLSKIEDMNTLSIKKLDSMQAEKLNGLKNNILECFGEIKVLIGDLSKNDTKEILEKLNKLKQSDLDVLLQRSSGIATLISFFAMFV